MSAKHTIHCMILALHPHRKHERFREDNSKKYELFANEWVSNRAAELGYLREVRDFDVNTGPHACAQVRGAREHVAQVFVPHVFPALLPDLLFYLHTEYIV